MSGVDEQLSSLPGFGIVLPDGFLQLPHGELDMEHFRALASRLRAQFGLSDEGDVDQGVAEATAMLVSAGAASAAGNSTYTAAGFFRSPDDLRRPIMVLVNAYVLESDHQSVNSAIASLEEIYRHSSDGRSEVVDLPAGRAAIRASRLPSEILVEGESVPVIQHAIVAWIPDPTNSCVVGIAVSSNNTEDWDHVEDLARGVFETFEWTDVRSEQLAPQ